jgi:hypothetical protein
MPAEFAKVALLDHLYKLRRGRRVSASIITTYSINVPFYEDVVLRYLEAAGSRLNVVIVDAGEFGASFAAESSRPRRAGHDYVVLPVQMNGAFHPKILALFSDEGMAVAVGSHNLTEAGFGRNGEISGTFGFDMQPVPLNVSESIADYLIECAAEFAPGDAALSKRIAERLQAQSRRGAQAEDDIAFVGKKPEVSLIDRVFNKKELEAARRVLLLGPYFDDELAFLGELRKRARQAALTVAIQPDYSIMRYPDRLPARTRLCDVSAMSRILARQFIHAKGIVVESAKQSIVVVGSANPSRPAWLASKTTGNFEAVIAMRGEIAKRAVKALLLDQLWDAPTISKEQLRQIEVRSLSIPPDSGVGIAAISGLWKDGWIEAKLQNKVGNVREVRTLTGPEVRSTLEFEKRALKDGKLRFASPEPGMFEVDLIGRPEPMILIASSARELSRSLVSGPAARLIDELGRLSDGAAPGEELINLCEKVLLQGESEDTNEIRKPKRGRRSVSDRQESDDATYSPRGISIQDTRSKSGSAVAIGLDISAIITLLLKQLSGPQKESADPTADDPNDDTDDPDDDKKPENKPRWEDVVRAIRPRVTRLLNRLSDRIDEDHSAKWKYERVLVTLALLKRLRKFHPGLAIPFSGAPERLVDDEQLRDAFKLAMRCWFARESGAVGTLEQVGGIDSEHEVLGRALLLWIAYEAGSDVAQPPSFHMEADQLRAFQADRTDALISAIAAAANQETLERARHEIFDRGEWEDPCDRADRIEAWFRRHIAIGQAVQRALAAKRPPTLPTLARAPAIQDIVVWKHEPGWPRFPEVVTGRSVHLAEVGDEEPILVARQFVQAVDLDRLGIAALLASARR